MKISKSKNMKNRYTGIAIVLTFLLALLSGCATVTERHSSQDVAINKGVPVVYIHPKDMEAYRMAAVCIPSFRLPANMDQRMGEGIASMFKDVLLGKGAFPKVKTIQESYGSFDEALLLGKRAGTDLVLAGKVNYAMEGSDLGGTRVDLSMRLLNVSTGATVWHIGQTMDQPMDYPKSDFLSLLFGSMGPPPIKSSGGAPAMSSMLTQVAVDMADVVGGARYVRR